MRECYLEACPLNEKAARKLIEGIGRYGLENVSVLSKFADVPVETARYMIWEEFPKHNVRIRLTVNFAKIGLGRWLLQITPTQKSYTGSIDSFLKDSAGPVYVGRVIPENSCIALLGIPFGEQYKLREQLAHLRSSGVIESYSLDEIEWIRGVSFNPAMYDFKKRDWNFSWNEVDNVKEPLATLEAGEYHSQAIDYKDILILKELQQSIPRTLSKHSKRIGQDQHNLRYHYKTHVRGAISGYFMRMIPSNSENYTTIIFSVELQNDKTLGDARSISLRIPFTHNAWKTERNYYWIARCPGEYTSGMLRYVNERFLKIQGKVKVSFIDTTSEYLGTIPHALFDENKEAWKYDPKIPSQMTKA